MYSILEIFARDENFLWDNNTWISGCLLYEFNRGKLIAHNIFTKTVYSVVKGGSA